MDRGSLNVKDVNRMSQFQGALGSFHTKGRIIDVHEYFNPEIQRVFFIVIQQYQISIFEISHNYESSIN